MRAIIILISFTLLQCQSQSKEMPETEFYLSDHKVTYCGKELPFGQPITEWVKLFGPYDRRPFKRVYVWDSLGLYAEEAEAEEYHINELYIFFMNLESPLGLKGELRYARGRVSSKYVMEQNKNEDWFTKDRYKDMIEEEITGDEAPKNYVYPYVVYKKPINIEGALVQIGMPIKEINKERSHRNIEPIRYIDANMNWKNESGVKSTESDGYFSTYFDGYSTSQPNYYNIMYYQNAQEVEHIRIVHDTGQDYFKL